MKHSWKSAVAGVAVAALAACGSSSDIENFSYGVGNPGADLPEGGDVRIERVYLADGMHNEGANGAGGMTWLQVYRWKSTNDKLTTKKLPPNGCTDLRTGEFWPNSKLDNPAITDVDMGASIKLTGPAGVTELPKCTTETNKDATGATSMCNTTSTPPRALNLMYGGLSAGSPQGSFLGSTVPAETVQAGADYKVDIGVKADDGSDLSVHIPKYYKTPLGIGSEENVKVAANADLELNWTPPEDEDAAGSTEHTPKTHFGRLFVLDTNASSNNGYPLSWVCTPEVDAKTGKEIDGHITVPASIVNQWPATGGLLVHAELTHYMQAVEGRRLDLVGIWCHVSPFTKE